MNLHHFSFSSPQYLWALLFVPLLFGFVFFIRRRRSPYTVTFTNIDMLAAVAKRRRRSRWRRALPVILLGLALATAAAAAARPRIKLIAPDRTSTIILVADVSDSMRATDLYPNRLRAAVVAMHDFVDEFPPTDKVGLVSFSDKVQVLSVPTLDHSAVHSGLDVLTPLGGTALGDGIAQAIKIIVSSLTAAGVRHTPGEYLPAAIVLESDGAQNRGTVTSFQAAELAKATGIRIYGVAEGSRRSFILNGTGIFAQRVPVPPDRGIVALLARESGGEAFNASDSATLSSVYKKLGSTLGRHYAPKEITSWFELAAAIFLVAGVWAARARGAALP